MKKIILSSFYTFLITLLSSLIYAQEIAPISPTADETQKPSSSSLNIFTIHSFEDDTLLVSLSDIYNYSPNEIIIPGNKKEGFTKLQYKISASYRASFLTNTALSETDTLYIHHYPSGKTISLPVKDLDIIAHLNDYRSLSQAPFSDYDYMLGFEIPPEALTPFKGNIYNSFVYIGQENPFIQKPLTPLSWHKIDTASFPATTKTQDQEVFSDWPAHTNLPIGDTYLSETEGLQYYLQNRTEENGQLKGRRLLVTDPKTQQIILDKFFYEHESSSPAELNGEPGYDGTFQWAGKLFKDKPPVTFGFTWVSFGCPSIWVTAPNEYIPIHCDNRH